MNACAHVIYTTRITLNMYNRQKLYFMLSSQVILYFICIYGVTMFYDSRLVKTCENITLRRNILYLLIF